MATTIPFTLNSSSRLEVGICDVNATHVGMIAEGAHTAGNHAIAVNTDELGIPVGNYLYRLDVTNVVGTIRKAKMMTAVK